MNLFKRIYTNIEPEVKRFPGVVISTVVAALSLFVLRVSYSISLDSNHFISVMSKSSMWSVAFLIFVSFLTEFILKNKSDEKKSRRISLIVQTVSLFICYVPMYFLFSLKNIYFWNFYLCSIAAMIAMTFFFAGKIHNFEDVIPGFVSAFVISLIILLCVSAGLCLILWAVDSLLFSLDSNYFLAVFAGCFFVVFINCTLAYSTRNFSSEKIAKPFKSIVKTLLFSLYIILVFVIYAYLIKSIFTKKIPVGKINWLVSFVSAFYLFFQLSLKKYTDDKVVSFFYKSGFLILIPLITIQCIAVGIRVNAYGLTVLRYESILYIIFSVIVLILSSFKNGEYIKYVYPVFAFMLMVACVTPLNLEDVPRRDHIKRIERIYKSHGMFKDNSFITENAGNVLSEDEKAVVCGSYDYLSRDSVSPLWQNWSSDSKQFEQLFGFKYSGLYDYPEIAKDFVMHKYMVVTGRYVLDVSRYSTMEPIAYTVVDENHNIFILDKDLTKYDVTKFMQGYLKDEGTEVLDEPLVWEISDGIYAIVTKVDINLPRSGTSTTLDAIQGFLAK